MRRNGLIRKPVPDVLGERHGAAAHEQDPLELRPSPQLPLCLDVQPLDELATRVLDQLGDIVRLAERADAYLYLARIYWQTQRGDEARTACMNAITINANFREALRFMATLSFEHNAVRWREFAEHATNERVLFVRTC